MSDFERQLRDTLTAAVANAHPPDSVMESVRQRYRRRNARLAVISALALAVLVAVIPVASALRNESGRPAHNRAQGAPLFPGGGRILLDRGGVLEWLYPDRRIAQVASGFAGAALEGGKLLAWKHANPPGASRFLPHGCFDPECTRIHDLSYYTMNLDGSDSRLVLPAESPVGNIAIQYEDAQLSPEGSRLAYISQEVRNGTSNIFLGASELWSLDLATGQKTDLGPCSAHTPFAWKDNATIIAASASGRSIQLVNARDGATTTYLTVDDPRLIHAYQRARPGNGRPSSISLDGWNPGPSALAVSLAAAGPGGETGPPAEIVVERGRVLVFAPGSSPWISLTMKWGPNGVFLLESQSNKPFWNKVMYAGTLSSERLSRVQAIQVTWNASAVNPEGTVIALAQPGFIDFVPVPSPACDAAGKCLRFQDKQLLGRGALLAWDWG